MTQAEKFDWAAHAHEATHASYDCSDNKIRIYTDRVPRPMFDAFRKASFNRAPKQGCFFATWKPWVEDIALALCGEIGDEDTTIFDRAEVRSDRFATHSENAAQRSDDAHAASLAATEGIPAGQPIMVNHRSEKVHRKAIEKAKRQTRKAVEEHDKSGWWAYRAKRVAAHAEYKFKPGVIVRRLKKLGAQRRKMERAKSPSDLHLAGIIDRWFDEREIGDRLMYSRERLALLDAEQINELDAHLDKVSTKTAAHYDRWIAHIDGQIEFWKAIYEGTDKVAADKHDWDLKAGGWVLYRGDWLPIKRVTRRHGEVLSVTLDTNRDDTPFHMRHYYRCIVKREEIKDYNPDGPGPLPPVDPTPRATLVVDEKRARLAQAASDVEKITVEVAHAIEFFPTPDAVITQMLNLALLTSSDLVLEPSAGEGAIVRRMRKITKRVLCCEINLKLRQALRDQGFRLLACEDFLESRMYGKFDAILMNPPFSNGQDVAHITHAFRHLRPGGRLVSVACSNIKYRTQPKWSGFRDWLEAEGGYIVDLPDKSFKSSGTDVATVLVHVGKRL